MTQALVHHHAGAATPADHSPIQKWINKLAGIKQHGSAAAHHGAHAFRQAGEAVLTGGILGAVNSTRPELSDKVQMGTAAVGLVGSVVFASSDFATDMRNVGSDALAVFSYRKGDELMTKKRAGHHGDFGSDGGEDPVVAAARALL